MQYVWQHRLWEPGPKRTVDGRSLYIIDPGRINHDSGPDFFNAKIRIDGEIWSGNVEIHVRASDWIRHKHHTDPAYDSVILHVVGKDDLAIHRSNGHIIPQLCMPCAPDFAQRFANLVNNTSSELACAAEISKISPIHIHSWMDSLAYSRLQSKSDRILNTVNRFHGDWEEACYITLARALGFGINNDAFERLATSLPLRLMRKHSDSLLATEALLFGQAGFLSTVDHHDPYLNRLESEYRFLSTKYSLQSPQQLLWKMARMRPANFPHRRIAFLASMMEGGFNMMGRILDADTEDKARSLFSSPMTGYWTTHYGFGADSGGRTLTSLSDASIKILLINVVIPLQYAYGTYIGDDTMTQQAVRLLQELPPERNSIISLFQKADIKCRDAFESQALIELRRNYCDQRKCLYCRFGHQLLSAKVNP